jgi:hypothetical protein
MPDEKEKEEEKKETDLTLQDLINSDLLKKKIDDILKIIPPDKRAGAV